MQAIEDYLMDVKNNAKEHNSALFMTGIFSFEDETPKESWLFNGVENLKDLILSYRQIGWTFHISVMQ